jgi:hypothetical protein
MYNENLLNAKNKLKSALEDLKNCIHNDFAENQQYTILDLSTPKQTPSYQVCVSKYENVNYSDTSRGAIKKTNVPLNVQDV